MFVKVFAVIFIATAILHQAAVASSDAKNWSHDDVKRKYDNYELTKLAFTVNGIYKGDLTSFQKMVDLQIYLFKLFNDKLEVNDEYVFNVAYYFSSIKTNSFYSKLSSSTKKSFEEYFDYLPPSATKLFSGDSFCLMNREHDDKYLYTSHEAIDNKRNYIFLSTKDDFNKKGKSEWKTTLTDASTSHHTKLKFTLKSVRTNHYAYVERSSYKGKRNLVASWNSSSKPSNTDWIVTLYQDQLIFSQDGRIICASDHLMSDSRRYVYGEDENGQAVAACQWFAKECP